MPFGTITSNAVNYEPRANGTYNESSATYADPFDGFKMRGGAIRKDLSMNAGITRIMEKLVGTAGDEEIKTGVVSVSITVPDNSAFTPAELSQLVSDVETFATPENLSRLLLGEV